MKFAEYHDEVLAALQALGNPAFGRHMAQDRGSALEYVGVRVPALRRRVREGFSFYDLDPETVLAVWDDLWMGSRWGDVLFAAEEYYRPLVRKYADGAYWPVMQRWIGRVDNWCHSDVLSGIYSRLLEADPATVVPVLEQWNVGESLWPRRASLVSLIHYTGKYAVFLTPEEMLPMVDRCVEDRRQPVQKAVGWVLREMWRAYPAEVRSYLEANAGRIAPSAFTRSMERMDAAARREMRAAQQRSRSRSPRK